jgi:hypothetical protein
LTPLHSEDKVKLLYKSRKTSSVKKNITAADFQKTKNREIISLSLIYGTRINPENNEEINQLSRSGRALFQSGSPLLR